jgi:ATP-dependent Clp protease ATP-binding subunit ClpA
VAEQTKTQLVARVAQVKNDLDDLTALEQALALDQQHAETNELAAEMRAMMESLDPTAKAQRWVHRAATLPFVSPWIGRATEGLLQDIQIQLSARRTRQARTRTAAMRTPATQNATSEPPSGPNATPEPAPIHLLVGPAGVGKTRLAVQLPLELNHRHRLHTGYIRFTPRTV